MGSFCQQFNGELPGSVKYIKIKMEERIINNNIKGAIFDVDGVLLDSLGFWKDLGKRYLIHMGKMPEEGLSEILFPMSLEQGADYLNKEYALNMTREDVIAGIENMLRDFYFYEVKSKPGALELVNVLKAAGCRMIAATESPRGHVERALARNGILDSLEGVLTCSEIGSSKHSPRIYDVAAAALGTKKEETWVFEDSLYGLKTAAGAGYHTVGVYDKHGDPNQKKLKKISDVYVRNMRDLLIVFPPSSL